MVQHTAARRLAVAFSIALSGVLSIALPAAAADDGCASKYGPADEIGAANLLSPELAVAAARLVKTGKTYRLGVETHAKSPAYPPRHWSITITSASIQMHGMCAIPTSRPLRTKNPGVCNKCWWTRKATMTGSPNSRSISPNPENQVSPICDCVALEVSPNGTQTSVMTRKKAKGTLKNQSAFFGDGITSFRGLRPWLLWPHGISPRAWRQS